ncbi:hypothetical protein HYH03_005239 [Edaphochlamys debaryana]|uniref:Uncharacterized protein n=1 Tax=Edaphochlamys debaryana TaxID=47281 RepID=A0A835YFV5_9CHLO|nr:hypothetical protein HYH03_005239 [Edaphochlamys debaryana]|eukprot:KAG2496834.1 hypothetical protein HYH03_005239 [Edaphochlamys debaryana]
MPGMPVGTYVFPNGCNLTTGNGNNEFCAFQYRFSEWTGSFPAQIPASAVSTSVPPAAQSNPWYNKADGYSYFMYVVKTAPSLTGIVSEAKDQCGSCASSTDSKQNGVCTFKDKPQGLSHWTLMLPDACRAANEAANGTYLSSPTAGSAGWIRQDPTSCATGWKWDANSTNSSAPGQTLTFLIKVKGNNTDPYYMDEVPFAVKGSIRAAWSTVTTTNAAKLKAPNCKPCNPQLSCCPGQTWRNNTLCSCDPKVDCCPGQTWRTNAAKCPACNSKNECCPNDTWKNNDNCVCDPDEDCCRGDMYPYNLNCIKPLQYYRLQGKTFWSIGTYETFKCGNASVYGAAARTLTAKLSYYDSDGNLATATADVDSTGNYDLRVSEADISDAASSQMTLELVVPNGWSYAVPGGASWTITKPFPFPLDAKILDTTVARPYQASGNVYVIKSSQALAASCVNSSVAPKAGATTVTVGGGSPLSSPSAAYTAAGRFAKSVAAPALDGSVSASVGVVPSSGYETGPRYQFFKTWSASDFFAVTPGGKDNRCLGDLVDACLNVGYAPRDVAFTGSVSWNFTDALYKCASVTVELKHKAANGTWVSFTPSITATTDPATGQYTITVPAARFDELDMGSKFQAVITGMGGEDARGEPVGNAANTTEVLTLGVYSYSLDDLKVTRLFPVHLAVRYDFSATPEAKPACAADGPHPTLDLFVLNYGGGFELAPLTASATSVTNVPYGTSGSVMVVLPDATNLVTDNYSYSAPFGIGASDDLCAASYPVCLTLGTKPIEVSGQVQWSFPSRTSVPDATFTCEAVPLRLRLKSAPHTVLSTATSSLTDGSYTLTGPDGQGIPNIPPGTELEVQVMNPDNTAFNFAAGAPHSFVDGTTSDSLTVGSMTSLPAATVKVTRTFTVKGALRYDMRTSPKEAFEDLSCASSTREAFNIPDWSPLFPSTAYARVCVGATKCTDSEVAPLVIGADGTFTASGIVLSDEALRAEVSSLLPDRITDDPAAFRTQSPNLMDLFTSTTSVGGQDVPNLCLPDVPICLSLGVKEASVSGNVEWIFPSLSTFAPGFACEAISLSLRATVATDANPDTEPSTPTLATIATTEQALAAAAPVQVGDFTFGALARIPPDVTLEVWAQRLDSSTYAHVDLDPEDQPDVRIASSQLAESAAWTLGPLKVTRTFAVSGTLRYDLRASPSKTMPTADKCTDLDASIPAAFPAKFPEVTKYANVLVGAEAQAVDPSAGTFAKSGLELGAANALWASLSTTSDLLDTGAALFRTSADLTAAFKADLCAASTPVCMTVGLSPAVACGSTKWGLNGNTASPEGDMALETVTSAVKVTSTATAAATDLYTAATGLFTIPAKSFASGDVTFTLSPETPAPAYYLIEEPYNVTREMKAADAGSAVIVDDVARSTGSVYADPATGLFTATVLAGGTYRVTALTFFCSNPTVNTAELQKFFDLVPTYSNPATASEAKGYWVDLPYKPNLVPPTGGCGHTLGFWKNMASNSLVRDPKSQYTRDEFLPIVNQLIAPPLGAMGYMRPDVLHFPPNVTYVNLCLAKSVKATEQQCQDDWKFVYIMNVIDDVKSDLAKLLRQLLTNEISYMAGYKSTPLFLAELNHHRGEFAAWNGAKGTGLFTNAQLNSLASYFDSINNISPGYCGGDTAKPGTQYPLPYSLPSHRRARRMAELGTSADLRPLAWLKSVRKDCRGAADRADRGGCEGALAALWPL